MIIWFWGVPPPHDHEDENHMLGMVDEQKWGNLLPSLSHHTWSWEQTAVQPNKSNPNPHLYSQAQSNRQNNELIGCTWKLLSLPLCDVLHVGCPTKALCGCSNSSGHWHPHPQCQRKESMCLPRASIELSSRGFQCAMENADLAYAN